MSGKIWNKPIYGIGINNKEYDTRIGYKRAKEYLLWVDMLRRCTEKHWSKWPTYYGTTCSENFKSYSYFYEWCNKQIGFGNKDEHGRYWHLDKDLLGKGSKVYSENTCVFVPSRINSLTVKSKTIRGEFPIGVYWDENKLKFRARCWQGSGKSKFLGDYCTPEQAFLAYKTFKEAYIKQVANEYKDLIDPRAYQALLNYTVEITD